MPRVLHDQPHHMRTGRGFTLIEVLTVISIIAILAAMIFPVFTIVRRHAQQTSCISNLRQIHLSLSMYIQDFDGVYPVAVNPSDALYPWLHRKNEPAFVALIPHLPQFHEVLMPYTRSREIFWCPADFGLYVGEPYPGWLLNAAPSSYAVFGTSYFYRTKLALRRANEAIITKPADTPVLLDASGRWHGDSGAPLVAATALRYNVLFADGHVRKITHPVLARASASTLP